MGNKRGPNSTQTQKSKSGVQLERANREFNSEEGERFVYGGLERLLHSRTQQAWADLETLENLKPWIFEESSKPLNFEILRTYNFET